MSKNSNTKIDFQKNVNIKDLFLATLKRWYILLGVTVISVVLTYIYSTVIITPMYRSTAKIMVFNKENASSTNDIVFSSYLLNDFAELINDSVILQDVSDKLDNKYSINQIKKYISVYNPSNTRIIEISALTPNKIESKQIVDTVCLVAQENLVELMGLDRITLISKGDVNPIPSTPNIRQNCVSSAVLGLVVSFFIILCI